MALGDTDLGQHCLRQRPGAGWHQAITRENIAFSLEDLRHLSENNFTSSAQVEFLDDRKKYTLKMIVIALKTKGSIAKSTQIKIS